MFATIRAYRFGVPHPRELFQEFSNRIIDNETRCRNLVPVASRCRYIPTKKVWNTNCEELGEFPIENRNQLYIRFKYIYPISRFGFDIDDECNVLSVAACDAFCSSVGVFCLESLGVTDTLSPLEQWMQTPCCTVRPS
jgi:hypothetical protein